MQKTENQIRLTNFDLTQLLIITNFNLLKVLILNTIILILAFPIDFIGNFILGEQHFCKGLAVAFE